MEEEKEVVSSGSEEETTPPHPSPPLILPGPAFRWFNAVSSNLMEHHVIWEMGQL